MNANQKMMAIAIRKSLLKETHQSQRTVFMNNGDEFQIQLFNPENVQVGCLIYINGKRMSSRKIVLRPGERVWLDRHIDTPDRLKFTTYEVENGDPAVLNAIKNNGNIKVEFYRERTVTPTIKISYNNWSSPFTSATPLGTPPYTPECVGYALNPDMHLYCATAEALTSASAHTNASQDRYMETGRVDKGSHSEQEFTSSYEEFEYFPFRTEEVKILPMSQKPVHINDLQKRFCPYCGRKTKDGFKFCPHCGKEL